MAAEISGMDHAGHCLSVRADLEIFHLGLGNQSMNRDCPAARLLTGKICRERQGVASPLRDDRLAIRRGFPQDAVGIGNQKGAPEANGPEFERFSPEYVLCIFPSYSIILSVAEAAARPITDGEWRTSY